MAYALVRSAGSMHRLAQAGVASTVLVPEWVQPVGITSLLAWHRQSSIDHRKMFSSEDKQGGPQASVQHQAETSKQSGPDKPQEAGTKSDEGTPQKTVAQDPPDLFGFFTEPFRSIKASAAVWAVKTRVETAFDEKEFLEGAKDAWVAVNSCMNDKDMDKLEDMCTPGLMTSFREVFAEQAAQDRYYGVKSLEVAHAQVAGATFLLPDAPPVAAGSAGSATLVAPPGSGARPRETYWSQWALNMAKDALGGSSLAMWVRFSGCLNQVVTKDKHGKILSELEDRRSSQWLFVRGPLPEKLPVRELDIPWQVMGFQ